MEEIRKCPVCGQGYCYPSDDIVHPGGAEHRRNHNSFIKRSVIVSKYTATKAEMKQFADLASPRLIQQMTALVMRRDYPRIDRFVIEDNEDAKDLSLIILHKNRRSVQDANDEAAPILDRLVLLGYAACHMYSDNYNPSFLVYGLTLKGFRALAGCLERDLICQPQ